MWVLSAIPEAKGLIMQECRTNPQVVDPNDLSQSQVMWAAGWAGPRSLRGNPKSWEWLGVH